VVPRLVTGALLRRGGPTMTGAELVAALRADAATHRRAPLAVILMTAGRPLRPGRRGRTPS
ncbi:MAG TPA: hypothetical protein VFE42_15790, partial [Chloroflexota bacterium]|nr:hypothetical protein [Chloroflexota bacterium]